MLFSSADTGFTIRPLTPQDEPFLWDMLYQAIYVPEGQAPPPRSILKAPELAHYVSQWGQRPDDLGVLAALSASHQPVGAAWLRVFSRLDPGYGFVDEHTPELSVALLPDYRGQGVGSSMLKVLLEAAAQTFTAVSLSVSANNPAKGLYQRLGFDPVKAEGESLIMLKRFV